MNLMGFLNNLYHALAGGAQTASHAASAGAHALASINPMAPQNAYAPASPHGAPPHPQFNRSQVQADWTNRATHLPPPPQMPYMPHMLNLPDYTAINPQWFLPPAHTPYDAPSMQPGQNYGYYKGLIPTDVPQHVTPRYQI